jgi:hypothetical protein
MTRATRPSAEQRRARIGSALVELMTPAALALDARICGWTLARARARSGDPVAIAAYLGNGDAFDRSVTDYGPVRNSPASCRILGEAFVAGVRRGRRRLRDKESCDDAVPDLVR